MQLGQGGKDMGVLLPKINFDCMVPDRDRLRINSQPISYIVPMTAYMKMFIPISTNTASKLTPPAFLTASPKLSSEIMEVEIRLI
ncbi:hypothetical protein MADA3029_650073 [Vibrio nigripulchritudo MADA3029]|nr:hypothetical protein VIBNIMADA3020_60043 [Vibrio nigripulchritudo MADA3020]CCN55590.1 hypothetical protein VIBNIMADA3021_790127 [Vibrio nigripulchritudo MADA3021]CCN60749.1 hypothetical protein MADA3029_650073 [Vibrio nigripulchritudo MADA3029]